MPAYSLEDQKNARRDGKLVGWKCTSCGHTTSTPMWICPKDRGRDIQPVDLPLEGEVVTYTIQKISSEEFINDLPFAFVVVRLDDGTKISGWVPDVAREDDLPLGTRVRYSPSYKPGIMFEKA